jgi:hypothetical protein
MGVLPVGARSARDEHRFAAARNQRAAGEFPNAKYRQVTL